MKAILTIVLLFVLLPLWGQEEGMRRAVAAYERGDFRGSAGLFAELLKKDPADARLWLWRGKALFGAGEVQAALAALQEADRLRPGYGALWMARVYAATGDEDKAFTALESHLSSRWRRPRREILLDTLLEPLEGDPRWRALWQREWYTRRERASDAARGALLLHDAEAALQEIEGVLAQYPDDPHFLALKAMALTEQGRLQEARKVLGEVPEMEDSVVLRSRVLVAEASEDHVAAAHYHEQLFGVRPDGFRELLAAAEAWKEADRPDRALRDVRQYLVYFPGDAAALTMAGEIQAARGETREALRLLSEAIAEDPGDPLRFLARANVYMKTHTYRYAAQDYGMALDLDPYNGEIYYRRGEAYLKTGETEKACYDFERALHYGVKKAKLYLQKYCGKKEGT